MFQCACSVILLCSVLSSQKMSNSPPVQIMEVTPAPETPSPGPNLLNFTAQVHSLLNGESPAHTPSESNIPGAPVSILDTSTQGGNSVPDEAGNTNEDEADTTSSQGGADPNEDVNRSVQQFFQP